MWEDSIKWPNYWINMFKWKSVPGYLFKSYNGHVIEYEVEIDKLAIPEVTQAIRITKEFQVQLFYKGAPIRFPIWFRHRRSCRFDRKKKAHWNIFLLHQVRKPYFKISAVLNEYKHKKSLFSKYYSLWFIITLYIYSSIPSVTRGVPFDTDIFTSKISEKRY